MSKTLGKELPEPLLERLNGRDLAAKIEKVILVISNDANGWPHPAMLSYRELAAKDRLNLRLATWKSSTSTNNMRRNPHVTVLVIDVGITYYIKASAKELRPELSAFPHISLFNLAIDQILEDVEPAAPITSGVTYRNTEGQQLIVSGERLLQEILQ